MTQELKTGSQHGYLRIATEEAFATQEQMDAILRLVKEGRADKGTQSLWGFYGTSPSERTTFIRERLLDLGPLRLEAMDAAGIDKAVLALTSPGVQSLHDPEEAKRIAGNANDRLKDACDKHPERFVVVAEASKRVERLGRQEVEQLRANAEALGESSVAELCAEVLKTMPKRAAAGSAAAAVRNGRHLISRSRAFEARGVFLQDTRGSWSGVRKSDGTVVMTIWAKGVASGNGACSYLLWAPNVDGSRPWSDKAAGRERLEHCRLALKQGGAEGLLLVEVANLARRLEWLKDRGVTAIITAERGDGALTRQGLEEYVSDSVILLDNRVTNKITTRLLRVIKYSSRVTSPEG